jgi:hypothetical protein
MSYQFGVLPSNHRITETEVEVTSPTRVGLEKGLITGE